MDELPEDCDKNAGVLRVSDDAIHSFSEEAPVGEIDPYPSFNDQDETGDDEGVADRHLDCASILAVAEQSRPQMAAAMNQGDPDLKEARQHVNCERKTIHLTVERDDKGLH